MSKKSTQSNAAAQRRSSTSAASSNSSSSRNPKLDWDFEHTLTISEMADAISADMSDVKVGYNTNEDGDEFPVFKVRATKRSITSKLPKEARGYVTFAPSMALQEAMEEQGEKWSKAFVNAHARNFGFIPHPEKSYAGIGKLCQLGGNYEVVDLSDLLEDEEDE